MLYTSFMPKATFEPNTAIRNHALLSAENTFKVVAFAVATAQCPLMASIQTVRLLDKWTSETGAVKAYADVTQEEKSLCGIGLSPRKAANFAYLWEHRVSIHEKYLECRELPNGHLIWWNYCMDVLCGMGLVKAAFCTQLLFGELGCVDVHNARELGIPMPTGKSGKGREAYLTIQAAKTSEAWWNEWCDFIADKYPTQFADGNTVSVLHEYAITGDASLIIF
jgi:hypothetical protein